MATCFDLYSVIFRPSEKQIQELSIFQCNVGSQMQLGSHNALKYRLLLGLFHRRPEDDPMKFETFRSDNILSLLYIR